MRDLVGKFVVTVKGLVKGEVCLFRAPFAESRERLLLILSHTLCINLREDLVRIGPSYTCISHPPQVTLHTLAGCNDAASFPSLLVTGQILPSDITSITSPRASVWVFPTRA
jgi:hypothetical protein